MLVMLVDDSRSSLMHLQRLVEQSGDAETCIFTDPILALRAAGHHRVDIVIVDYVMLGMDGVEFIRRMRAMPGYVQAPIIMLTATTSIATRLEALEAGATDFLEKGTDALELRVKLRNLIAMSDAVQRINAQAAWLAGEVEAATAMLLAREEEMIFRLSLAVEYRDNDTGGHTLRVAHHSRMIAEELALPPDQCRAIYLASPLHDVGKVAIPDQVLLKPGQLDDAEMALIRTHAAVGARILGDSSSDLIRLAAEIAGHHHERWDGTGYPSGLRGEAIPLSARIVAVADVFDALTTARPYKDAMPVDAALAAMAKQRGRHFDPSCVDAFLAAFAKSAVPPAAPDTGPPRA